MSSAEVARADNPAYLQLSTEVDEDGTAAPVLPIRWCVSPGLVAELRARQFTKPYLVISVRHKNVIVYGEDDSISEWAQTKLYLAPLKRELTYVSFSRPGENEVRVAVVDLAEEGAAKALHEGTVFNSDGSYAGYRVSSISESVTSLMVQVPADMFAREPSPWVQRFVGNFFESNPFDECHFRRRKIVSFGLFAPLLLAIGMPLRLITAMASILTGRRRMDWRGLRPFNMDDVPWGKGRSVYRTNKHGRVDPRRFPLWFLNPMTLIGLPVLTFVAMNYAVAKHHGNGGNRVPLISIGWWQSVLYVDGALVILTTAICIIVGLSMLGEMGYNALRKGKPANSHHSMRRTAAQRERERELQHLEQVYAELEAMACTTAARSATLDALPRGKRTAYLRYNALKAQVCKPFAR